MENKPHIEFSKDGKPLVSMFDEFSSRNLSMLLALFFFMFSIAIGMCFENYILSFPILIIIGYPVAICLIIVSDILAVLLFGLILGDLSLSRHIMELWKMKDFVACAGLIPVMVPVAIFATRAINRSVVFRLSRKILFCVLLLLTILCIVLAVAQLDSKNISDAYVFTFLIIGVIYSALFWFALRD